MGDMAGAEENTRRIVLLGKSGSGKSSLANTLCGEKTFSTSSSPNSETNKCQSKTTTINGRNIKLIDTPGLFDTDPNSNKQSPEFLECIKESAPGPHAFLFVLKVETYTVLEQLTVALMLKHFSVEALKYTTVVFTHGNQLEERETIEEWVQQNKTLKALVDKCGGRCCVVDNKHWNNQLQIDHLLQTIDRTVKENGGGYYTNENMPKFMPNSKQEPDDLMWKSVAIGVLAGLFLGAIITMPVHGAVVGSLMGWLVWLSGGTSPPTEKQKAKAHMDEVTRVHKEIQKYLGI